MKAKKPFSGKESLIPSIRERITELPVINDIDEMLIEGMSANDVAKFIQLGLEEMTDVAENSLAKKLFERRSQVLNVEPEVKGIGRRVSSIVPTNQFVKSRNAMDRLIELESIYLLQKDRLKAIVEKEKELGFPFEMTDRTVVAAVKILEEHGKQEQMLFERVDSGHSHEKLDIQGYSKETAQVLQKPDSRRRVISIVERLKRIKGSRDIPGIPETSGE